MANNQFTFKTHMERVFSKIEQLTECGCWIWMGSLNSDGYGQAWDGEKMRKSHALVYEMVVGPIPEGLEHDHKCRVRCCVNPAHLEPVTHGENMRRGIARCAGVTHCRQGHPYSGRNLVVNRGRRSCRECRSVACQDRRIRLGLPVGMGKGGRTKEVRWGAK